MSGVYGADVAYPATTAQWQALKSVNSVSFAIVRCYESTGNVDPSAPDSVQSAWAAGLTSVDVYHFPCCRVPAADQIKASVEALSAGGARVGRYWIDVEQGAGWPPLSAGGAVPFLQQLIQAAESYGLEVGIYTSVGEWSETTGNSEAFSSYPLWYAHYDGVASFEDFPSFGPRGGWTQPTMKQFLGDQRTSELPFDGNWAPQESRAPGGPGVTDEGRPPSAPGA
jgi:GH25 family lysozyme M1 (1,4-beta-N-acetylmuramidase)